MLLHLLNAGFCLQFFSSQCVPKCLHIIKGKDDCFVLSHCVESTLLELEYLWYNIEKVFEDNMNITLFTGQGVGHVSQMVLLLVLYWLHGD